MLFEVREVLTVPLWKCGAEKPHSPSCSSCLCRDSSPMQLSLVLEFLEEQGKPLAPVCSLIHRYSAVSVCQRGPSQRQCLALIAETGVDQLLWDFSQGPLLCKGAGTALWLSS